VRINPAQAHQANRCRRLCDEPRRVGRQDHHSARLNTTQATLILKLSNGERIETTPEHLFYVQSQPVSVGDGSHKVIEQIHAGDCVTTRDKMTGAASVQRVVQTFKKRTKCLVKLRLSNGETIRATPEPPRCVEARLLTRQVDARWNTSGDAEQASGGSICGFVAAHHLIAKADLLDGIVAAVGK